MLSGKVKWFSAQKGYGFITASDKKEYFVHYTGINSEGFRTLQEGQSVSFEVTKGNKGDQASNVSILNEQKAP